MEYPPAANDNEHPLFKPALIGGGYVVLWGTLFAAFGRGNNFVEFAAGAATGAVPVLLFWLALRGFMRPR